MAIGEYLEVMNTNKMVEKFTALSIITVEKSHFCTSQNNASSYFSNVNLFSMCTKNY